MDFATSISDMLRLDLPVIEKALRPIVVYLFLLAALRLAGKRELAQFTTFDFVLLLMISNTVQNAIIGEDSSVTGGLIGATVLLLVNAGIARLLYARPRLNRLIVGDATTVIEHGKVLPDALRRLRLSEKELVTLVRRQNFDSIGEVEHAEVEPTGTVSMRGMHPTSDERTLSEILERLARIEAALVTPPPVTHSGDDARKSAG